MEWNIKKNISLLVLILINFACNDGDKTSGRSTSSRESVRNEDAFYSTSNYGQPITPIQQNNNLGNVPEQDQQVSPAPTTKKKKTPPKNTAPKTAPNPLTTERKKNSSPKDPASDSEKGFSVTPNTEIHSDGCMETERVCKTDEGKDGTQKSFCPIDSSGSTGSSTSSVKTYISYWGPCVADKSFCELHPEDSQCVQFVDVELPVFKGCREDGGEFYGVNTYPKLKDHQAHLAIVLNNKVNISTDPEGDYVGIQYIGPVDHEEITTNSKTLKLKVPTSMVSKIPENALARKK